MSCKCNECKDPLVLPIGPKGDKGDTGNNGAAGATGATGATGAQGVQGNTGAAGANGSNGRGYDATSSTSLDTLTTLAATASATITTEKAYTVGARVRFSDTASPATNFFEGICTAYNTTTGAMTVSSIDLHRGTGTIASWDVNLAGEHGFNVYDSGWKTMNSHNGTFGLAPVTGWTNPSIRVIGKTVFISGHFIIPLAADVDSTNLRTPWASHQSTYKTDTQTYTCTDGGFTLNTKGSLSSKSSIVPADLRPTANISWGRMQWASRNIEDTVGGSIISCNTFLNSCSLTTGGLMLMTTHKDYDDSVGTAIYNSSIHEQITVADTGAAVPDYSGYKHQFGGFAIADSGKTYPTAIDGEDEGMLGGYWFTLNFSYPVGSTKTEQEVKAAFDSI